MKLTYGFDIALGQFPALNPYTKGFAYIPDKVMRKEVDEVIDLNQTNKMLENFDLSPFRVFSVGRHRVFYFDDGFIEFFHVADWDTYNRQLNEIFGIIGKHFPEEEIATKFHPGHPDSETRIKIGTLLPSFIPAEFLYNDDTEIYLSLCSTSIVNVEKGVAISIANLVTFNYDDIRESLKEDLINKSKSEILFPKTLEEFERILIDFKE